MKKIEVKSFGELIGKNLKIAKISDSAIRNKLILFYASVSKYIKEFDDQVETVRAKLIESESEHSEELDKYSSLMQEFLNPDTPTERRAEVSEEIQKCKEAIRINSEFQKLVEPIENEEVTIPGFVPFDAGALTTALIEGEGINPNASIDAILNEFKPFIAQA